MLGTSISHYQILQKIGEGGMGVVWKARDIELNRFVALKVLPPEMMANPVRRTRFLQEAQAASALNHPNIITIYDVIQQDENLFIVMEWVQGKTLDQIIPKKGMRLSEALKAAVQITDALAKAHRAGIIHCDLKPGNVMMADDGNVKVLDFGLAKVTEAFLPIQGEDTRTLGPPSQEGMIVGTISYLSPEQAEGRSLDARSDIFSFGSLLYEMVTGQRAFFGDTSLATLAAILQKDPKPISQVIEQVPQDLAKIITRCLRKDPERRFQNMADVRVALLELKEESDSGRLIASDTPVLPRKRLYWTWLALLLGLTAAGAGGWQLWERMQQPEPAPPDEIPITTYPGTETSPTISPDGRQFAFVWDGGEPGQRPQIYVSMVGQGNSVQVTKEEAGARSPAWSPDGQRIAYLTSSGPMRASVNLIPPLGGAAQTVGKASSGSVSWFPDGKSLCVADWVQGRTLQSSLFVLPVDSGDPRQLFQSPETSTRYGDSDCAVSPSGMQLAFVRRFGPWEQDLFVLDLNKDRTANGAPRQLTNDHKRKYAPVWTPDQKELIYTAGNDADEARLYRVIVSGKEAPRRIDGIGEHARDLALSKGGRRLIYSKRIEKADIYRTELVAAGKHTAPQEFLSSTMYEGQPSWSPDGEHIAFASNRSGGRQIWVAESDGTNPRPLTAFVDSVAGSPQWSPDSRTIAFDARPGGNPDVYVVAASGGVVKRMTEDAAEDHVPSWSDDGRWICFASARSGRDEIYRMPATGGTAEQLTKSGGYAPIRLVAGRFLYYSGIAPGMHKLDLQSGDDKVVAQGIQLGFAVHAEGFASSGRRDEKGESPILFYRFSDASTKVLTRMNRGMTAPFSLSPSLRWMVYGTQESSSDIRLVENFR